MHRYIQKVVKQQVKQSKISLQTDQSQQRIFSEIRKSCETGQHISEQKLKEVLTNKSFLQKQRVINELLMFGQIKIIQNLIQSKAVNKSEVIDSNRQLKILYSTVLNQQHTGQNICDKIKKDDLIKFEKPKDGQSKQRSKKQLFLLILKKLLNSLKTLNLTYVGAILGFIFILLLLRRFKQRIVPLLRSVLNI